MFKLFDPVYECVFDLDFLCKLSKLWYNSLAFVTGVKGATGEGSLRNIAHSYYISPFECVIASKGSNIYIIFTSYYGHLPMFLTHTSKHMELHSHTLEKRDIAYNTKMKYTHRQFFFYLFILFSFTSLSRLFQFI